MEFYEPTVQCPREVESVGMAQPATTDRRILLLHEQDNVCTAIAAVTAGTKLLIQGREVTLKEDIPLGFKIAARDIAISENIIKYGVPIGHASRNIESGELVHLHNLASNYLPTYSHGQD